MFLQDNPHDISDFLHAVQFVSPEGMELKYFIVPIDANTQEFATIANDNGYNTNVDVKSSVDVIPGVTDTLVYKRKDMKARQSFGNANFDVSKVPNEMPITKQAEEDLKQYEMLKDGGQIESPIKGVLVLESTEKHVDLILKESVGPLPKYTLCHFVRG